MHAIGHYVIEHNPNAKVVYLSSENLQMNLLTLFVIIKLLIFVINIVT